MKTCKVLLLMPFLVFLSVCSLSAQSAKPVKHDTLIPFKSSKGKWGYLNAETGGVVVKPKYDQADLFKNGFARVWVAPKRFSLRQGKKTGFGWIDRTGTEIVKPQFISADDASSFGTMDRSIITNIKVVENKKEQTGLFDLAKQEWIIPPGEFQKFSFYDKNHFIADGKVYFANGKRYQAPKGYAIDYVDFDNKLFFFSRSFGEEGVSTWQSTIIVPPEYRHITLSAKARRFVGFKKTDTNDLAEKGDDIDEMVVDLYDFKGNKRARHFSVNGGAVVSDEFGFLDMGRGHDRYFDLKTGHIIEDSIVINELTANEPSVVTKNDKYGVVDENGKLMVPLEYDLITDIDREEVTGKHYYKVEKNGEKGLMDEEGNILIPIRYDFIRVDRGIIKEGWVRISKWNEEKDAFQLNKRGLYNIRTGVMIPTEYARTEVYCGVLMVSKVKGGGEKFKLLNAEGKPIIGGEYKNMRYKNGYFIAESGEKSGVLSLAGEILIPFKYDVIFAKTRDLVLAVEGNLFSSNKSEFYINVHTGKEYRGPGAINFK